MNRGFALALAVLVSSSAAATGGAVRVCRWTGKVMNRCPCPARGEGDRVEKAGCCELRAAAPRPPAAVVSAVESRTLRFDVVGHFETAAPAIVPHEVLAFRAGPAPPADGRRFLTLKRLLI